MASSPRTGRSTTAIAALVVGLLIIVGAIVVVVSGVNLLETGQNAVGALFPKRDWTMLSHHVIWHGRRRCHAKKPACGACPLARLCPSFGAGPTDPIEAEKLVTTQGPA